MAQNFPQAKIPIPAARKNGPRGAGRFLLNWPPVPRAVLRLAEAPELVFVSIHCGVFGAFFFVQRRLTTERSAVEGLAQCWKQCFGLN